MSTLYELFRKAPELGSLIDPGSTTAKAGLFDAQWDELASLLDSALTASKGTGEAAAEAHESVVAAQGMAFASRLLSNRYHLVVSNPPYVKAADQGAVISAFCQDQYPVARHELANVFLDRAFRLCRPGGTVQFVMPQNWLYQPRYELHREALLGTTTWQFLVKLGPHAFEGIGGEVVTVILFSADKCLPSAELKCAAADLGSLKTPGDKAVSLYTVPLVTINQLAQAEHPGAVVRFEESGSSRALNEFATFTNGIQTGDYQRFGRVFCEVPSLNDVWIPQQSTVEKTCLYGGCTQILLWERGRGALVDFVRERMDGATGAWLRGQDAWGKRGIQVSAMGQLFVSLYAGQAFDDNCVVILPNNPDDLGPMWAYCSSNEYAVDVRKISQALKVRGPLLDVPFDVDRWRDVSDGAYPDGLPLSSSSDPTQWIFHGHPQPATDPLQVAVARLLGYRWPAERDDKMELSHDARAWVSRCSELDSLCDDDGIVCLPAVRGEAVAADRLRTLLARAFGADWSAAREAALLREAGCEGLPLAQWLRDKFFAQHVARFQKRPFIWHVWDGHKEGFSALVNVHTLTRAKLQTLIHTYLGDWITQQKRAVDAGDGDATLRLARAKGLNDKLEAILEGESPYDIFVRWKPAHLQPIGWEPDLNDGVRMNIRPFVQAEVLRIPGRQLGIKWEPDRGKDVPSAPWFKLGPTYGEPEGTRINDHHLSLADKQAARAKVSGGKKS